MTVVRSIFSYDRAGWRPVGAILRLLGVALSAVGGEAAGGHGAAVLAGVGALYAGIASFGGVHGTRLRRMVAATFAAAVATLIGSLAQPSDLATTLVVPLISLGLGVLARDGPDAAQVALLATGTLIVFSGLHGAHAHPLGNAALVLGGGLGQAAILIAFHPLSPIAAERRAVEEVYDGLMRFARARAAGRPATLPSVGAAAMARDLVREGLGYGSRPELTKLWSELELADALRGNLAGLDRVAAGSEIWAGLADWLATAKDAVGHGRRLDRRLSVQEGSSEETPWIRRLARTLGAEAVGRLPTVTPPRRARPSFRAALAAVQRDGWGHELRYAVAIGIATAGYRLLGVDHGYWAPLSLAFCLRPDFAGTLTRGLGRVVGTLVGVGVATGFVLSAHPGPVGLTVAMLGAAWAAFALQGASYLGYSAWLAFYVVVSVTLAGASAATIGVERIEATVAGALLALATALVWPRWEAGKVRRSLAVAFAAQAEYAQAVASGADVEALTAARLNARYARLEAERIFGVARFEPHWSRGTRLDGASIALARLEESAARILAAHVAALDPHGDDVPDDLRHLAAEDRGAAADLMG